MAIFYFAFHMLTGDQGVLNWMGYKSEIQTLESDIAYITAERARLQATADALSPQNLDMDKIDERARALLGYVHPDDIVIQLP